jgi:cytochrome c-type biogenesis protein
MEFLLNLVENSQYAFLTAFVLGIMTAISPCPLATNITAVGFISRDISNRKTVFYKGLVYTLGRAFSYFSLGLILWLGASKMKISLIFQGWGEKLLGPLLILIGVLMLDLIPIRLPSVSGIAGRLGEKSRSSYTGTFLLGMIFALAFCPYSAVLFFMMLMPLAISSPGGLGLPLVYAFATGLPVILFAWLLAFAVGNVASVYQRIKGFELGMRRLVALLFIGVGLYYVIVFYFPS